jgi:hypothetical protein
VGKKWWLQDGGEICVRERDSGQECGHHSVGLVVEYGTVAIWGNSWQSCCAMYSIGGSRLFNVLLQWLC